MCEIVRKIGMETRFYFVYVVVPVQLVLCQDIVYVCPEGDLSSRCGADTRDHVQKRVVKRLAHVM